MPRGIFVNALLIALMSIWVTSAFGGCALPAAPTKLPDGAKASDSDMREAMQTLKHYDVDVSAYLKCLAFEQNQGRLSKTEEARLHNAALDKLNLATGKFNEQMKIFMGH